MKGFRPVTSRLIARKERKKQRKHHEARLRRINNRKPGTRRKPGAWVDSGFDNAPPKTVGMRHLAVNAKRERMIEERCEEIEKQNKLLLSRMTKIMSSKGVFKRTTEVPPHGPRSLNIGTRRKELMRIVTQNEKILARINSVEPQYNVKSWERDFEKMSAIRESLSNFYPDEFGNDAEATDAMKAAGIQQSGGSSERSQNNSSSSNQNNRGKGNSVRSASAARSREKETRLDRVLLVSRERGTGKYAAERPKGAATTGGVRGRRARRGQSAAATRKKPSSTSVVHSNTQSNRPMPPQKNTKVVGGRAAVTARAAASQSSSQSSSQSQAPESMSSGLLKRNDSTTTSVDGSTTENEKNAKIQKDKADEAIKLKLALETEAKTKAVADAKAEAVAAEAEAVAAEAKAVAAEAKAVAEAKIVAAAKAAEDARQQVVNTKKIEDAKIAAEKAKIQAAMVEVKSLSSSSDEKDNEDVAASVPDTIEENIQEEERRWDGDSAFTQQEFIDFYGGLDEWSSAVLVKPGELHNNENKTPISQDVTQKLDITMSRLPKDWNMSVNCKIDGMPLNDKKYTSLATALQENSYIDALTGIMTVTCNNQQCGGINENSDGTFVLMKTGQAIISSNGTTAYVPPLGR